MRYKSLFLLTTSAFIAFGSAKSADDLSATPAVNPTPTDIQKQTFAPLFKKVSPAVVSLYALRVERELIPFTMFGFGHFDRFEPWVQDRISQSIGSGSIITPDGLIITNAHVIHGAKEIKAVLYNRREVNVEVVLEEPECDLAVLKIKDATTPFSYIELADSDQAEAGDVVLAIGNPFGLSHTLTQGIISAVGRTHMGINPSQSYIQADAVINPGNSGGALITQEGKLLGVCTFILSKTGASNGIGFAIPSNILRPLILAAKTNQKITRPWLGLEAQGLTSAIAESLGLKEPMGAIINQIYEASPVSSSSIGVGDIIVGFNGKPLQDEGILKAMVSASAIGDDVTLDILKKATHEKVSVKIKLQGPPYINENDFYKVTEESPLKGCVLAPISAATSIAFKLGSTAKGIVIYELDLNSTARHLGLLPGDILESINGKPIRALDDVQNALKQHTRSWQFQAKRGEQTILLSYSH
jgi:Do/DeqQ family serine protease